MHSMKDVCTLPALAAHAARYGIELTLPVPEVTVLRFVVDHVQRRSTDGEFAGNFHPLWTRPWWPLASKPRSAHGPWPLRSPWLSWRPCWPPATTVWKEFGIAPCSASGSLVAAAEWLMAQPQPDDREQARSLFASIIDDAQHWSRHAWSRNATWLERTKVALKGY